MNISSNLTYPNESFFTQLKQAPNRLLMLDYDGTLSPFVEDRFQAVPYPGVTELLYKIIAQSHSRLVIVTGRPLNEILPLLNMNPAPEIWGSHGWQHLLADGSIEDFPLPADIQEILNNVKDKFQLKIPMEKMDVKPSSVAVHWRGLSDDKREHFSQHAQAVCQPYKNHAGLELEGFDGGLELRVKGRDKGTSVNSLLAESPDTKFTNSLGSSPCLPALILRYQPGS